MVFTALTALIEDVAGTAAESYISSKPILGTLIRAGNNEGLSGNQILSRFRLSGGKIANQTFWGLRGQILSQANKFSDLGGLLGGDDSAIQQIGGGRAGSYRVQFRAYYQRTDELGNIENGYQQFTIHQRLLDVPGAMQDATDIWGDNSDTQSFPGQLLGLETTGIYQYTGL